MHGSIVNVPKKNNLMQNILPKISCDDYSIVVFLKRKLENQSMYMSSYICPNIVMKELQELCENIISQHYFLVIQDLFFNVHIKKLHKQNQQVVIKYLHTI
jgi:hypothetical protein